MKDPLKPSIALLVKLGSIAVHTVEMRTPAYAPTFDDAALDTLLNDPEVCEWMRDMDRMAFLPKMRRGK